MYEFGWSPKCWLWAWFSLSPIGLMPTPRLPSFFLVGSSTPRYSHEAPSPSQLLHLLLIPLHNLSSFLYYSSNHLLLLPSTAAVYLPIIYTIKRCWIQVQKICRNKVSRIGILSYIPYHIEEGVLFQILNRQ